jgi:hypothetical protein
MIPKKTPLGAGGLNLSAQGARKKYCRIKNITKQAFRQRFKALVVLLAVRGVVPIFLAEWLIDRGGLRHD